MRVRSIFAVLVIAFMLGGQPASLEAEPASVIVVLDPIDNPDGDGTYTISWREVTAERIFLPMILRTADPGQSGPVTTINTSSPSHTPDQVTYTLEEDDSPIFDSAQVVYQGPLASVELTDRAEGVYYYRVKRDDTSWSNHQPAVVHVQSLACQTFVEDFTDTDYCDVENTTADWDTNEGNLKLGNTLLPALREGLSDLSAVYVPVTGKVYVLGGDDGSFGHQRIREFDPATGKVSELSAMLSFGARKRTSAVYASETGKIYVFGGSWGSSSYPSDDVVEFDPVADQARALSVKLPSEREYTSATYVPETGKAYVFGGRGESGRLDEIVEFDPVTGNVNTLPVKLPAPVEDTSAVYVPETGKVYIFGGYGYDGRSDEIIAFDPVAGTTDTLSVKLPSEREGTSAVYAPETVKVYVFGGNDGWHSYVDDVIEFDPVAGTANTLSAALPTSRAGTAAAYVPGTGKAYVFGGYDGDQLSEMIEFDPIAGAVDGLGSVSTLSVQLPAPVEDTSAVYVPGTGEVYIFGGYGYDGRSDEIIAFDPVAGTAYTLPVKLPSGRQGTSAVYAPETVNVYVFGGNDGWHSYVDDVIEFDPVAGTIDTLSASLPTSRAGTAAAYVPETGKAYVFGGYDGEQLDEIVEFDPATGSLNTLPSVLPEGLSHLSAVYAPVTGMVYVLGGDDGSFGHQRIREFDPATGQVSELSARLSYGARKRTSAAYSSETGKIYVFGGSWSTLDPSDDVVEFDPVADQARALSVKLPSEREYTSATYVPETGKAYVFGGHGESGWLDRIVEVRFDYYAWAQQAQSLEVDHWSIGVLSATLSADQILSGQAVSYALSNDGGTSWEDVTLDVDHVFSDTTGADLRWRSTLSGDGKTTPEIERLSISYCPNRTMDAPVAPSLGPITNTNTDGYYPLAWSPVPQASAYVVEESSAANFSNAVVMFVGAQTDLWITRRELGPYYYRVRAWNARGNGDWSDEQHTIVTQRIAAPALDPIENGDGWASYVLTWEEIGSGVSYTLQRDVSPSFPSPATVYEGGDNSSWQAVSELGTYYYRVKAADVGFESAWSSEQSVEVAQLCPEPGHYAGEPDVSFDVTDNCQVCDFDITVPFGFLQYCRIRPSSCANITSNNFGFASIEIGAIFVITGTFDSPMDAIGGYSVSMCEDQLILPPSEGTWEASK